MLNLTELGGFVFTVNYLGFFMDKKRFRRTAAPPNTPAPDPTSLSVGGASERTVRRIKFSDNENERAPLCEQFGFFATM